MGVVIAAANGTLNSATRRWLDRGPDGRLWALIRSATTTILQFWYSDNNGVNWTLATGTLTDNSSTAPALFVDVDGNLHVAYEGAGAVGRYCFGTVSGTTITWSAGLNIASFDATTAIGDLVAFRHPSGSGWVAMIGGRSNTPAQSRAVAQIDISAAGVPVWTGFWALLNETASSGFDGSIDFHHTGDGKTVQGGTPHVYVAWKSDLTGNVWFNRLTWNGTGYTLGSKAPIDTGTVGSPLLAFDGTRVAIVTAYPNNVVALFERDAGHTATISRGSSTSPGAIARSSMSYDRDGNVHVVIRHAADDDLYRIVWTRATLSWGAWTYVGASVAPNDLALRVGWHTGPGFPKIEALYLDSTNVSYQGILVINAAPSAPTVLAPVNSSPQDVAATLGISWQFNDPDLGDSQTAYTVRRRIGVLAFNYWNGTSFVAAESGATKIVSGAASLGLSAGWGTDGQADHFYSVKTWDQLDQISPWSAEQRIIPSGKDDPTITDPASNGFDITTATYTVVWTVLTQTKYRIRVIGDTAGAPNPTVVDYDSGTTISTTIRSHVISLPVNSVTRQIELTTWNDEGLQSTVVYRIVDVAYTPPATPTVTLNLSTFVGAITVTINNGASGPTPAYNDLYRRIVGDTSEGIRVAAAVAVDGTFVDWAVASGVGYEYRVKLFATSGAIAWSAWVSADVGDVDLVYWLAQPATYWMAPTVQGTGTGLSSANAAGIAVAGALNTAINTVGPGGVIEIRSDLGAYQANSAYDDITTGGMTGLPVVIRGPSPASKALIRGDRTDPWILGSPNNGDEIFQLGAGATNLIFANMTIENAMCGWQLGANADDLSFSDITSDNCQRTIDNRIVAGQTTASIDGLVIQNLVSVRGTKGVIRLDHDTRNVAITDVSGDSLGVDGDNFTMGIQMNGTVHDVVCTRVHFKNSFQDLGVGVYWNADGFVSEELTHHLTFVDCSAKGCTDAGFDLKSDDVQLTNCVASDNKRNFRFWGLRVRLDNCTASHPNLRGGTGTQVQLHTTDTATVEAVNFTATDWDPATIVFDLDGASRLTVTSATVIRHTGSSLSTVEGGCTYTPVSISDTTRSAFLPTAQARWEARKYVQTGNWVDLNVGHDFTAVSVPVFTYDGAASYWRFSGDDAFTTPDDANLDFGVTDDLTVLARIRFSALPGANASILSKKTNFTTGAGWSLFVTSAGVARFMVADGTFEPVDSGATLAINTWYVLVGRRTATDLDCFVDAVSAGPTTDTTTGNLANALAMNAASLAGPVSFFAGDISHVAIWRSALSNGDILALSSELVTA